MEEFLFTADEVLIYPKRHLKVVWKHKRPLNPEDEVNTFIVDLTEIFVSVTLSINLCLSILTYLLPNNLVL